MSIIQTKIHLVETANFPQFIFYLFFSGNLIVDAELLAIAHEIMKDLNILPQKNVFFRLNHTSLLRAILMFCNVPVEKYDDVFAMVTDYMVST